MAFGANERVPTYTSVLPPPHHVDLSQNLAMYAIIGCDHTPAVHQLVPRGEVDGLPGQVRDLASARLSVDQL